MRNLNDVYGDYDDRVEVLIISTDPSESAGLLRRTANERGYPWEMTTFDRAVNADYGITSQSTEIIIDGDGVVTHRGGYGSISSSKWRETLDEVTGG